MLGLIGFLALEEDLGPGDFDRASVSLVELARRAALVKVAAGDLDLRGITGVRSNNNKAGEKSWRRASRTAICEDGASEAVATQR